MVVRGGMEFGTQVLEHIWDSFYLIVSKVILGAFSALAIFWKYDVQNSLFLVRIFFNHLYRCPLPQSTAEIHMLKINLNKQPGIVCT